MHVARLKALTFDVTNTLLKARSTIGHQYADAALAHGIRADPDALDSAFDSTFEVKKHEMPDYGKHHGVSSRDWWSDLVKRVFIKAGHTDANPETLSRVFETLWEHFTVCVAVCFVNIASAIRQLTNVCYIDKSTDVCV